MVVNNLECISNLTKTEKEAISELVNISRQQLGSLIKEIILFGSKVNGKSDEFSDIDILFVLDKVSWEIKELISGIAADENIKNGVLISTLRYSIDDWENPVVKSSPFAVAVRNDGIRL